VTFSLGTRGTSVQGTFTWMSPEQALSDVRKTYTLCDMFSFGLIVKWLLVGIRQDIPFKDLPTDKIIEEHKRLHDSAGSLVHPYVEDLSLVPPVFRTLIQFCTATDASKRWTAPRAMWELCELKSRFTVADESMFMPAALQVWNCHLSPPPPAEAASMPAPSLNQVPVVSILDLSGAAWQSLFEQMQGSITPEGVASIKYYRDIEFAATLCGEFSEAQAAEGALADAAHYAAASEKLYKIVNIQGETTSQEVLTSLLEQVKHAIPALEASKEAAIAAKQHAKSAGLQKLRSESIFDLYVVTMCILR
jgi:hypothetical protein